MTINKIFIILHFLKKYFFNINNRLNNIRHEKIKKTIKTKYVLLRNFLETFFRVQQTLLNVLKIDELFSKI